MTSWITETTAFYARLPACPISARGQAFWHYLLYRANAAWWRYPLCIRLDELAGALSSSISAVKAARAELERAGLIHWQSTGGSAPAQYWPLSAISGRPVMERERTDSFDNINNRKKVVGGFS